MEVNKVVAKFTDGSLLKGKTSDFFPNKQIFHLELSDGSIIEVAIEKLKAVFFVKHFEGDKNRSDSYEDHVSGGGRKIQVKFPDGELIIGYTHGYSPNRVGFFVVPADKQSNNERIFIVNASSEEISFT
jgi:hypothetical protein